MRILNKMMVIKRLKKAVSILTVVFISLSTAFSQPVSEIWAGGQISLDLVSGDCGGTGTNAPTYKVTLKFYRDAIGTADPLPLTKEVIVFSPQLNINKGSAGQLTVSVAQDSLKVVEQYCLNGNPVATEGGWYSGTITLDQPAIWYFAYVGAIPAGIGGDFRSPEDRNISLGQKFYIETLIDNRCGTVNGTVFNNVTNTYDPVSGYNTLPLLLTHEYLEDDPVASFCVDSTYNYDLKHLTPNYDAIFPAKTPISTLITASEYGDSVSFHPVPAKIDYAVPAVYESPYGSFSSFPSSTPISYDERNGRVSLTPNQPFAGPIAFEVRRYMNFYYTDPPSVDPNQVLKVRKKIISRSIREYRFIFDRNCNPRLPSFEGGDYRVANVSLNDTTFFPSYNPVEDAYEFECNTNVFSFRLSEPMLCNTIGIDGQNLKDKDYLFATEDQGFRMATEALSGGTPLAFLDDVPIAKVVPMNCDEFGEFDILTVYLDNDVYLGPGRYILYMKKGDDGNTMINRCESTIPEEEPLVTVFVNENFTYIHDPVSEALTPPQKKVYDYCYPNPPIPIARMNTKDNGIPDYVTWKLTRERNTLGQNIPENDTTFYDSTLKGPIKFRIDYPEDTNWVNSVGAGAGWWTVGFGKDFSTIDPATGDTILKRVCYDEDEFFVDTISSEPITIPDYDLCVDDPWPVINLDSMQGLVFGNSFEWYKVFKDFSKSPATADTILRSTDSFQLDMADIGQTGDSNLMIVSFVFIKTGCRVTQPFYVRKSLVLVDIGEDSVICDGEQYVLSNLYTNDYFLSENYTFEWFVNGVKVQDNETDTLFITETGEHVFGVTKTTPFSTCTTYDTVNVRIADTADRPNPSCYEITFKDGAVEQLFGWNPVNNAFEYQVQTVSASGVTSQWDTASESNLRHRVRGRQIGLRVRGINNSVDPSANCYRGKVSAIAEPCEAIVKTTNVFTPNGDGINDFLSFDLVEVYPGSKLQVYNRWGRLVYEDPDYFNDWDGDNLAAGTYFYVLDLNSEVQDVLKGTFTIFRD